MAKLIYSAIASLDGYVEDEHGKFDWAAPDEEVHAFVNDLERPVGTYLYGCRARVRLDLARGGQGRFLADARRSRASGPGSSVNSAPRASVSSSSPRSRT